MKKIFAIVACSLWLAASLSAQTDKTPFMTRSLSAESVKNAQVKTSGGNITVSGVANSEARVEVYATPNNGKENLSKDEIQQRLNERYNLDINISGGKVVATAKPKAAIIILIHTKYLRRWKYFL